MVESVERPTLLLDDLLKRVPMELDGPSVAEGDDIGLIDWALILLAREDVTMSPAELLELVPHHEADMLETHRVAGLMGRWDQFDQVDVVPVVKLNRLLKQELGNRTTAPLVLNVGPTQGLDPVPQLEVLVVNSGPEGEVADWIRGHIDPGRFEQPFLTREERRVITDEYLEHHVIPMLT